MLAPRAFTAAARNSRRRQSCSSANAKTWRLGAAATGARVIREPNTGARSISSITRISSSKAGRDASSSTFPPMPSVSVDHDWLVLNLRTEWDVGGRRYPAGALLIIALSAFLTGARDFTVLFEPSPRRFLQNFGAIGDVVAMIVLDNVRSRIFLARFAEGRWQIDPVEGFSDLSILGMFALAADDDDWFADNVRERGVFVVTSQNCSHAADSVAAQVRPDFRASQAIAGTVRRMRALRSPSTRRSQSTACAFPIFRSRAKNSLATARMRCCCPATAAFRFRAFHTIRLQPASSGWSRAAST